MFVCTDTSPPYPYIHLGQPSRTHPRYGLRFTQFAWETCYAQDTGYMGIFWHKIELVSNQFYVYLAPHCLHLLSLSGHCGHVAPFLPLPPKQLSRARAADLQLPSLPQRMEQQPEPSQTIPVEPLPSSPASTVWDPLFLYLLVSFCSPRLQFISPESYTSGAYSSTILD